VANARVLVVEDDGDIQQLVSYNLIKAGFNVSCADSGEEGLQILEQESVDLVLLDLMLPGMDGVEVCTRIRQEKNGRRLPVIMLTAKSEEDDIVGGLSHGADDYVTKPFSPRVLIARIQAIPMKTTRLFWQVFLPTLVIIASSILATTWITTHMIQTFYYQQMEEDIKDRGVLLRSHIQLLLSGEREKLQEFCRRNGRTAATRITVIDRNGQVLADSNENPAHMDNHATRPEIVTALAGKVGSSLRFSKTLQQNMLYVALPLPEDTAPPGVLRLSVPATAVEAVLSSIYTKIFWSACVIILLAACLSYLLARRISRPLEEMRLGAERLASGKTNQPVIMQHVDISRETAELAHALNNMAEQVNKRIRVIIQQRNELEAVFSSMTDGVLAIGRDFRIVHINTAAAEFFRINSPAAQGKPMEGILRNIRLQNFIRKAMDYEETLEQDLTLVVNGREMLLRTRAVRLFDGEHGRMGILVVMNNLTLVNRLETIRQDFVANVSHELKTPITAIRGYVETLLDGALDSREDAVKFLRIIDRQGRRLNAIVDDLLTLARIEDHAGKDEIILNREKILPILEAAMQTCTVHAEKKDMVIELDCAPGLTGRVNHPMLEQALINLLTNALTYGPKVSTVTIRAEALEPQGKTQGIRIRVMDQGPGIGPEHRNRIFERFYRCDKARSRTHGGTGLGLAIVKHIVQCHGGTVEVINNHGAGAVFILELPTHGVRS